MLSCPSGLTKYSGKPSQTIKAPIFFLPSTFGCLEADQRVGGHSTPSEQLLVPRTHCNDLPRLVHMLPHASSLDAFKATPVGAANMKPPALVTGP